ncbi:MAG TPA: hypothetical protein VI298_14065 [Geobacteraceae bacterium]
MKKRVLFLCTANSCRSQMAEFRRVRDEIRERLLAFFSGVQGRMA